VILSMVGQQIDTGTAIGKLMPTMLAVAFRAGSDAGTPGQPHYQGARVMLWLQCALKCLHYRKASVVTAHIEDFVKIQLYVDWPDSLYSTGTSEPSIIKHSNCSAIIIRCVDPTLTTNFRHIPELIS
jgi:hypothetical protein